MNIIMATDFHLKNEEPFFKAGVALDNYILDHLKNQKDPFVFLDGGDHFHVSKETGRVNGEVSRFFIEMAEMTLCESILIMQGNHDVKEETGSALDAVRGLHPKIAIIDEPSLISCYVDNHPPLFIYLLPHVQPYSIPGYSSIKSYGEENFHQSFWENKGLNWGDIKPRIKMVSLHGGDETAGKLFMNADISFLPGARSNGHVHKQISKNHLPSVSITRRDEIDKKCFIRRIDAGGWSAADVEIPLFLNYAQISYGEDIDKYFESGIHTLPKESLIVDIYGHDDINLVAAEYAEKWADRQNPKLYVGEVAPVERKGGAAVMEERNELDISSINIKGLFLEFCEEKKLAKAIADDLTARLE